VSQGEYVVHEIVDCTVTGYARYGVLIAMPSGAPGWIESEYLDDWPVARERWPAVGSVVTAVVLGQSHGRWRLSARQSRIELTRRTADPEAVFAAIVRVRRADEEYRAALAALEAAGGGEVGLHLDLVKGPVWKYLMRSLRAVRDVSEEAKLRLLGDVVMVVVEDGDVSVARQIVASLPPSAAVQALGREVDRLLEDRRLGRAESERLASWLLDLGLDDLARIVRAREGGA
jgi:hypothetical protein